MMVARKWESRPNSLDFEANSGSICREIGGIWADSTAFAHSYKAWPAAEARTDSMDGKSRAIVANSRPADRYSPQSRPLLGQAPRPFQDLNFPLGQPQLCFAFHQRPL